MDIEECAEYKNNMFTTTRARELRQEVVEKENEERYKFLQDVKDKNGHKPGESEYDPTSLLIPKLTLAQMTPFEKQYWNIKKDNFDTVIFFAKGKFYELYENDADIANKEMDLKVVSRVNMRMAGVPKASFSTYASKLLNLGYKIGCVDEMETSEEMKKRGTTVRVNGKKEPNIVRRELRRIYTVSTLTDPELCLDTSDMFCMSLVFTGNNVGVCYGDVSVCRFFLGYIDDTDLHNNLHTILHRVQPKEVIVYKTISEDIQNILKNLGFAEISYVEEKTEKFGKSEVQKLFTERGKVPNTLEKYSENEGVMKSFEIMVDYFRTLLIPDKSIVNGSFGEYVTSSNDFLIVDAQSIVNLSLYTRKGKEKEGTLLHFVDNCQTPFGKRILREKFILKPLMDVEKILKRQAVVEFFIENPTLVEQLKTFLKPLPDLERLLVQCDASTITEANFIRLIAGFETCQKLMGELKNIADDLPDLLKVVVKNTNNLGFPDLEEFISRMEKTYDFERAKEERELTFFSGYNEDIDNAFEKRGELEKKFEKELESVKQNMSDVKYISLNGEEHILNVSLKVFEKYIKKAKSLPKGFSEVNRTKNDIRLKSLQIMKIQSEYDVNEKQIADSHRTLFNQIMGDVAKTGILVKAVENIGLVDCFLSLSDASQSMENSSMPKFVKDGVLYSLENINKAIETPLQSTTQHTQQMEEDEKYKTIKGAYFSAKGLRHPYLTVSSKTTAVPSDIEMGGENTPKSIVLTGPNMGGKSTLLRTVCLAVIMAQMGMRCTAEELTMSVIDRIFTRIGASDDILHGMSTFMVELDETAQMLHSASENSLVVLDELGRGTSTHDGLAIAHAVVLYTIKHIKPLLIVSTHYHQLCEEFGDRGDVKLSHMGCTIVENKIVFLYKLLDGSCPKSYGMKVAEMAGIPQDVVKRAESIANWFEIYSWWKNNIEAQEFTDVVCNNKLPFFD
ncbi:DNA mismatch repair protein msH6, putative [Entamoeba invadens IP1]|uniref:DNA mismatch repair protein msH6, putative n=1 Tax=Entamoeba invadens IP1 TaxID=370355 RepID=UPI0002C3E0AE|nr:DNA mismatch repair protein msH6, putative [Entamoeba invadens IP1]ELP90434.1 DNA mismatch repair protein msH6, putative [Entamoeba invadens IP1]|eukprot:XP_004257205.1 DNA mismatch repair protein msH6, putative [Entamoeba invadens IP1]